MTAPFAGKALGGAKRESEVGRQRKMVRMRKSWRRGREKGRRK